MRKLTEQDRQSVLDYVMDEPEYNLFFIGDVANYGFDSPDQEVFAEERDGGFDSLLLRYRDTFVLYSRKIDYDDRAVAAQIASTRFNIMNGKSEIVDRMAPHFPEREIRHAYLARLRAVKDSRNPRTLPKNVGISQLGPEHAPDLAGLYEQVDEFAPLYRGRMEEAAAELRMNLRSGGRAFGAFCGGRLVAAATTSAENPMGAMVMGVATLPQYRGGGIATTLVAKLCTYCLSGGMQFLCLFYDNPAAGRIYRALGFEEMGTYTLLQPKQ